jgi:hypothetical protein
VFEAVSAGAIDDAAAQVNAVLIRTGTRRYCSTSCQNRVKTAAFRARLT